MGAFRVYLFPGYLLRTANRAVTPLPALVKGFTADRLLRFHSWPTCNCQSPTSSVPAFATALCSRDRLADHTVPHLIRPHTLFLLRIPDDATNV